MNLIIISMLPEIKNGCKYHKPRAFHLDETIFECCQRGEQLSTHLER